MSTTAANSIQQMQRPFQAMVFTPGDIQSLRAEIAREVIESLRPFLDSANRSRVVDTVGIAKVLNISESQVRRLRSEGQIPSFVIGSSPRFDIDDVLAFLKSRNEPETAVGGNS